MLSASRLLLQLAGILVAGGFSLQAQSDNFDDNNDNGWGRYNPIGVGAWALANGTYRIHTAPSPNPTLFGPSRAGSLLENTNYGDYFYASVDIVNWDDTLRQSVGLLARIGSAGPGTTTGYAFTWDRGSGATGGDVDMSRIDGEVPTGIAPNVGDAIHFQPGHSYRLVFIGKGASFEGRVYALPDITTPVVTIQGSDSSYTSGQVGLVVFANTATGSTDTTFDNFAVTDVEPPRIEFTQLFSDLYVLSWPAVPVTYALECSSRFPAAPEDWREILDVARVGDMDTYGFDTGPTSTLTPPKFFRLKRRP